MIIRSITLLCVILVAPLPSAQAHGGDVHKKIEVGAEVVTKAGEMIVVRMENGKKLLIGPTRARAFKDANSIKAIKVGTKLTLVGVNKPGGSFEIREIVIASGGE